MPEDAGKKKFIKDFLISVQSGEGFIEDIFIDRIIKLPDSLTDESTAQSLSGRSTNTITELLEDDLRHSLEGGYFVFRIVSAFLGSGKTSLLTYLHELIITKVDYRDFYTVIRFSLGEVVNITGSQKFTDKLSCYILAKTFYNLLNSKPLLKNKAESILSIYLVESSEVNQLVAQANNLERFCIQFFKYFLNIPIQLDDVLFKIITEISDTVPQYTLVYLIDEFDGLEKRTDEIQQTSIIIRSLIKKVPQKFQSKIRLFIYLVGTTENINDFFSQDPVINSLISKQVINLSRGHRDELEKIAKKISEVVKGAFEGYKYFDKAWDEIKKIPIHITPAEYLRSFCKRYATAILKIYEKYFREEPEKQFEGNARKLVESECKQRWEKYLKQKSYTLSSCSTTIVLAGHAFDCYVELLHNKSCVARCYGEAKNYDLLTAHLETFKQWLQDVAFKPNDSETPPDLAFMIAPKCSPLLERKLELENIHFIQSSKITDCPEKDKNLEIISPNSIDINTAEKELITKAFKGTGIRGTTISKLIDCRQKRLYLNLDDLVSILNSTPNVKKKLQEKLDNGEIYFSQE